MRTMRFARPPRATPILRLTLLATLVFTATGAEAQSIGDHPRVAEALGVAEVWLEAQRAYERIPGISAALVHDQELLWSGAWGHAHPERSEPATPRTLYSICSISKLFTSIAVMQLRDRGLLALSDSLREHLPWFTLRQRYPDSPPVTIEGILTHSAGLPRESDHAYWSAPDFAFPTREEIIAALGEQETLYPAWRYFQYSNLGLTLAGELVAAKSGQPYEAYVRANILEPLGLDDTSPEIPLEHRGGRLATGYSALDREGKRNEVPLFQAQGIAPAAGYASTVEDLARFASWQFRLEGQREEVLRPQTLQEMQRVHWVDPSWETHWGLGFSINRRKDKTFVGHGGSCPGFRSQLLLQMDDEVAAVFMANASGVNTAKFVNGMYDLVAPAVREAVEEREDEAAVAAAETAPGPDLEPYLGTYSEQPWGGETAAVRWKGGLALLGLPTDDPAARLTRLEHIEGDTFRRIRDDDDLGEEVVFERDASGRVVRMWQHGNWSPKVR